MAEQRWGSNPQPRALPREAAGVSVPTTRPPEPHWCPLMEAKLSINALEYSLSFNVRLDIFMNFTNNVKLKVIDALMLWCCCGFDVILYISRFDADFSQIRRRISTEVPIVKKCCRT